MEEKKYIEELFPRIKDIKDNDLREKVISVWLKAWKMSDYKRIEDHSSWPPASEKIKQPFHVRLFFFFAYMNLALVFVITFIIALWRWW